MKLTLETLAELPDGIARPQYGRDELSPGIVHIGLGNFHRAHQAVYLDDLFNKGHDRDWAIVGAGVRQNDAETRRRLAAQDWLTTVVELEPGGYRARVTGTMIDFVPVEQDNRALIEAMSAPATRIVSLTVTEGGYYIDPATGAFNPDHPDMRADAANPESPVSAFGAIVAALQRRRQAGTGPFTVMSCDNLPGNGDVARNAVLGLARRRDPQLACWIEEEVAFPNAVVDRITPASTQGHRAFVRDTFGIEEANPVVCEPFRQWVLEDRFSNGRPAFEEVGVTVTGDVAPFETMKIRILNGGHALLAYPSALLGLDYCHEAMAHPLIGGFLEKVECEEIVPVLPPVPDTDLHAYYRLVAGRFSNGDIADTIARLCHDGSDRQPKFVLPSIRDRLAQGLSVEGLALGSALWCRYCYGTSDDGRDLEVVDGMSERLRQSAAAAKEAPLKFLELRDVFGDLADEPAFSTRFSAALTELWQDGTERTLGRYLNGGGG